MPDAAQALHGGPRRLGSCMLGAASNSIAATRAHVVHGIHFGPRGGGRAGEGAVQRGCVRLCADAHVYVCATMPPLSIVGCTSSRVMLNGNIMDRGARAE